MKKSSRKLGLGWQSLEDRCLLAGDVAVIDNSFGGTLEIIGDDAANFLVIEQGSASDQIRITGLPTDDGPTTVNGGSSVLIDLINYDGEIRFINADMGGGNDLVFFEQATVLADINIETGAGDDDIEFSTTQVAGQVNVTGPGVVDVTIDTFYSIDDVTIDVEQAGVIDVFDARIDNGSLTISSQGGNNTAAEDIDVQDSYIDESISITTDLGGKAWVLDSSAGGNLTMAAGRGGVTNYNVERSNIAGDLAMSTQGGNDQLQLGTNAIGGVVEIISRGGSDSVTLDQVDGGNVVVNTGGANDTLYADQGTWQSADIRTGNGSDDVTLFDVVVQSIVDIRTSGGNDALLLSGLDASGTVTVLTGGGNDFVSVLSSDFSGGLNIRLGNGNDSLETGQNTLDQSSVWNGGRGLDNYEELAPNVVNGSLRIVNFESGIPVSPAIDVAIQQLFGDEERE